MKGQHACMLPSHHWMRVLSGHAPDPNCVFLGADIKESILHEGTIIM